MARLLTKESRVIVQGITGTGGSFHTKQMLEYGTNIVVGTPPGKGMGHAGAIVEGSMGTAQSELDVLIRAGAHHAKTFMDIPEILQRLSV